jgi:hydroxypyruvate reductase
MGPAISRILAAALEAVEPAHAVKQTLSREGDVLHVAGREISIAAQRKVWLIGFGKAAAPMGQAAAQILGQNLQRGLVICKTGHAAPPPGGFYPGLEVLEASHPVPDATSLEATRRLLALLSQVQPQDLVICLVSGGGSALLTQPVPGITLADLQGLTQALLACGANITKINTLRKHLDAVKGGGLARLAAPAEMITLILSDVIGDPLDIIASGPSVPDPSTYTEALEVLTRYQLKDNISPAILAHLRRGELGYLPETPKPGEVLFEHVSNTIIGSNRLAAQAALQQAQQEGFSSQLLTTALQGEASQAGQFLAALARGLASGDSLPLPACLILGGETTVTLRGQGLGGRCQELALGAVASLAGLPACAVISLATDGGDGPSIAAGAVATGSSLARARALGLNPADFLARNDSYHFFQALEDLLLPGPTQTNVNDLYFVFCV